MPRKKVPSVYKYGIELTKPFSKEMYNHNDKVVTIMKGSILSAWSKLIEECLNDDRYFMDREWNEDDLKVECPKLVKLQKAVCYSGYGGGYSIEDVNEEFQQELENMAPYQLDQEYEYMVKEDLVENIGVDIIGFEDKAEILELRKNSANINTMTVSFDNKNK